MATERSSMRKTREILRQRLVLDRAHRATSAVGLGGDRRVDGAAGGGGEADLGGDRGAERLTSWRRGCTQVRIRLLRAPSQLIFEISTVRPDRHRPDLGGPTTRIK
jgi:hypothetical protein